ncbi:GlxA family transcriptional regulator [Hwanghaeella sp.]|uniref:GlxA family transcriptional regulator n=1 Tax=Hwanghaeella sp. TaxID=2605943 RepID=UPI003CCBFF60
MQAFLVRKEPVRLGHLLLPRFSQLALSSSLEPFRLANTQLDRAAYEWMTLSVDGGPVEASNGISNNVTASIAETPVLDMLFVHASYEPDRSMTAPVLSYLRRQARFGAILVGIETGGLVLARAGVLDGYQATSHWEVLDSMAETFPNVLVKKDVFVFDRDRITAAGGVAAMDMAMTLIAARHGPTLATFMAEEFVLPGIRPADAPQRFAESHGAGSPNLTAAIAVMERNLEAPLPIGALARRVGISVRELERLFRRWLETTPAAYYRELRLRRARALLQQTEQPITEIALGNGFADAAHFSRAFKALFGHPPSHERRIRTL